MKIKNKKSTVLWSHLFFVVPLIIALSYQLYLYSLIIILVIVTSFFYHLRPRSQWHMVDRIAALTLISSNFVLFIVTSFYSPYFAAAMFFTVVGFYYFFKAINHKHYLYHTYWHLYSAIITVCSVIGYLKY
jgi:hypothetical protein